MFPHTLTGHGFLFGHTIDLRKMVDETLSGYGAHDRRQLSHGHRPAAHGHKPSAAKRHFKVRVHAPDQDEDVAAQMQVSLTKYAQQTTDADSLQHNPKPNHHTTRINVQHIRHHASPHTGEHTSHAHHPQTRTMAPAHEIEHPHLKHHSVQSAAPLSRDEIRTHSESAMKAHIEERLAEMQRQKDVQEAARTHAASQREAAHRRHAAERAAHARAQTAQTAPPAEAITHAQPTPLASGHAKEATPTPTKASSEKSPSRSHAAAGTTHRPSSESAVQGKSEQQPSDPFSSINMDDTYVASRSSIKQSNPFFVVTFAVFGFVAIIGVSAVILLQFMR